MRGIAIPFWLALVALAPAGGRADAAVAGDPAPEIAAGSEWIGAPPTTIADLRGRVVLVQFWTFGCHNCRNTLPSLRRWHARYADRGLVVVGVHTPEFGFERGRAAVAAAVERHGIAYPVVLDDAMQTWRAWSNRYWPTAYFVDRRGVIRHVRIGEGGEAESEQWIERLLAEGS